jgi:hypothetical protein
MAGSKPFSTVKYKSEGPDYRLYKSEPELSTVAEVDESNGEEKSEPVLETDTPSTKGSHFPVGVVPPRTKSPTPESSTIASYVTLRKSKKMMDLRTERPRSAVEQLCLAESSRPRMTVEEQMRRLRRHQQACLRERKKALSVIGAPDPVPLQSPSNLRDSPLRVTQARRREDHNKELDSSSRENDTTPSCDASVADTVQPNEAEPQSTDISTELKRTENIFYEMLFTPEPNGTDSEEALHKGEDEGTEPAGVTHSPPGEAQSASHKPEDCPEARKSSGDKQDEMVTSEPAPETARESRTPAVKSLSPSPESPASPDAPAQRQLTEGSHFMCV